MVNKKETKQITMDVFLKRGKPREEPLPGRSGAISEEGVVIADDSSMHVISPEHRCSMNQ